LTLVIEPHYLPCLAYFAVLQGFDKILLEKQEHYAKQTYRNRCYINTEHGRDALIVPLTQKHGKVPLKDVRIDYGQKWLNNHWRSIESAYRKAPFFEYYAADLERVMYSKHESLYILDRELLTLCLKWLRLTIEVEETLAYEEKYPKEFCDLRSFITPKNDINIRKVYQPVRYLQVFGNAFADNLSVLDLVFCSGPEAGRILRDSGTKECAEE
jgi:hypothetical protein